MSTRTKPSGLPWAGSIPRHWDTVKVCLVARLESGHTPSRQHPEYWVPEECTIPWFSLADVWQLREANQKYLGDTAEKISPLGIANSAARLLPADTVVLSRTASVGFAGVMPRPMATTQDFANWVCGPRLVPDYLLWAFRAMKPEFARMMMGSTHQTIYMPDIRRLAIPLPPRAEQRAIANFLDRKTAAINALIEKKESLLHLIAEKKVAAAATFALKGVRHASLGTDSGIPSVGTIPASWKVQRAKAVFAEFTQRAGASEFELLSVSHITGVTPRREKPDVTMFLAESAADNKVCRRDDLVVNTMWAWMGAVGVAPCDGMVSPSYNVYRLRRPQEFEPRYFDLLLRTPAFVAEMNRLSKGITASRLRLYPEAFLNMRLVLPPKDEQTAILEAVSRLTGRDVEESARLHRSVELLREYRHALITAVVTGQLDVAAQEAA